MQKINLEQMQRDIDKRSLKDSTQPERNISDGRPEPEVMLRFWKVMGQTYGPTFTTQYGMTPTDAWERQLTDITPDQIASGLNRLSERDSEFPPNAIEFRKLCLPKTASPDGKNSNAYLSFNDPKHPEYEFYGKPKQLEDKTMVSKRKQKGIAALDDIKGMLR